MRTGLGLFLRSRHSGLLLVALIVLAVVGRVMGDRHFLVGDRDPLPIPWAVVLPAMAGYLIAGTCVSPLPWLEHLAVRSMWLLRTSHVVAALVVGLALMTWSTMPLDQDLTTPAALRDLVGFVGLSLASIAILGVAAGWTVPVVAMFLAIFANSQSPLARVVDWPMRPDGDISAVLVSAVWLSIGIASMLSSRFRDAADQS